MGNYLENNPKYLLSPPGERIEVRGQRLWITLTPTLSPQGRGDILVPSPLRGEGEGGGA